MTATMRKPRAKPIDFDLPVLGIHKGCAWHEVPKGHTVFCENVLPYDTLGRLRVGTRPGTSKYFPMQFGGGAKDCQHVSQVTLQNTSTGATADYILAVFEGRTYLNLPGDVSATAIDGGSALWSTARRVEAFTFQNTIYMTDGLDKKKSVAGANLVDWAATAGSFPISSSQYPRYIAEWRGRGVLSHLDKGNAGIVFMTKQGTPTDFDYGATYTPIIAVATSDNFRAGQMPDPVSALIPFGEDILLVATCNTINKFVGDPADGGALVPISRSVGIHNNDAWCEADGVIYFVGSGGFYRMIPGLAPELLSFEKYNDNFRNIPGVQCYVECVYDKDRQTIWIFATKELTPFTTYHAAYHIPTGGFWPQSFTADTAGEGGSSAHDPIKACTFDAPAGRAVLLGCRDGYIRTFNANVRTDDGSNYSGSVYLGPLQPAGPTDRAMLNGLHVVMGENTNFGATVGIISGADAYAAYNNFLVNSYDRSVNLTVGGRRSPLGWRVSGNSFFIVVSGGTFDLERITGQFEAAGPNR